MMARRLGVPLEALLACALCTGHVAAQGTRADSLARLRDAAVADSAALADIAQQIEQDLARGAEQRQLDEAAARARLGTATRPEATPRAPQLFATREGERAILRVSGLAADVAATLSEPFVLEGSARVYLTLGTVERPRAASLASVEAAGLLEVRTEARDKAVRVIVDAPSIGAYGLEQRTDGLVLWLEAAPAAQAIAAAAEPQQAEALPEEVPAASVQPNAAATNAGSPRGAEQDERVDMRDGARAILVRMQEVTVQIAERTVGAVRRTDAQQWQLIGLIACLLLLPVVGWSLLRPRAPLAAARVTGAPGPGAARVRRGAVDSAQGRLWAARTLAGQGMEAGEIAERTGLCRDAVSLILAAGGPDKAAARGRKFRPATPAAARGARR